MTKMHVAASRITLCVSKTPVTALETSHTHTHTSNTWHDCVMLSRSRYNTRVFGYNMCVRGFENTLSML